MKTLLLKGTRIWLGNHSAILTQNSTEVDLENVVGVDAVAEVLAGNVSNYGINIAALAHEEDGPLVDGKSTTIHVSYGVGGARIETPLEKVIDHAAIQKKNVAEADAAVAKAKKDEPIIPIEAVKNVDLSDSIRIPDGKGGFQDPSKGDMHERLVTEMVNAPRQFIATGEITPGSKNAFDPPPTTETALAASDSLKANSPDTSTDPAKEPPKLNGPLPDDFPGRTNLAKAGINTYAQARKAEDGLEQIEGIEPQTATQIREALAHGEV